MSVTIGSSDVAAILGISPWRTQWDIREKLKGIDPPANIPVAALERGHLLEPIICEEFCKRSDGLYRIGVNAMRGPRYEDPPLISSRWSRAHCRPDFLLWNEPPEIPVWPSAIMEAKHAMILDPREWGSRKDPRIPEHYRVQCLWQAMVCNVETVFLTVWGVMDNDWRIMEMTATEKDRTEILNTVRDIVSRIEMDDIELDGSDACKRHVGSASYSDSSRDATVEEMALVCAIKSHKADIEDVDELRKTNSVKLRQCMDVARLLHPDTKQTIAYIRGGNVCLK